MHGSTRKMRGLRLPCSLLLLFLLLLRLSSPCSGSSVSTTDDSSSSTDARALLSFKSLVISDPSQALSSWGNPSLHFCRWRGVNCSLLGGGDQPRVTALELPSLDLMGEISPSLANLSFLRTLDLRSNRLRGSIPHELTSLSHLKHLDLSYNHLTGSVPPSIGNLSASLLSIGNNSLSGSIPAAIGDLSSLSTLDLNSNALTGAIPSSIGNLSRLRYLDLHANQLNGNIPSEIGNLANVRQLFLGGNQLEGTIPRSFGRLKILNISILSSNKLEAKNAAEWGFVDDLSNCTLLWVFDISSNRLSGILPRSIVNLSEQLTWLNFYDNQIAGSIPAEIGSLINLNTISIHSNLLTGPIPSTLGTLSKLVRLEMSENFFAGEIPPDLGNLTKLNLLNLASNELNGPIPPALGKCRLENLNLANNKLTGILPAEILSILSLSIMLNVSGNSLAGPLPPQIGNLRNTQTIDVSNNRMSGEIPSSIAQCQVLENLYLQGNTFQGYIPSAFKDLKQLQVLDVSHNNLSGPLPDCFRKFQSLTLLDLSYNNFDGEVPVGGVFSNAIAFSVVGNPKLCGGILELGLPPCSGKRHHLALKLAVIISAVAAGFIFLVCSFACYRCWFHKHSRREFYGANSCIAEHHKQVSFDELLRATDGFSPANLIGKGSFGSVYRGTMDWENHKDVAVKVLNLRQKRALKTFMAECNVLRNVRHRNLVKILTTCSSVDFQGNDFKALIFDYLPNGSLEKWLHPGVGEDGRMQRLSLIQRLNLSIDIASALAYLHHHGTTPIVHCDLKPSNVLLDHDLVAHVSDFGLAKFLQKNEGSSTSSITLKGSIGYVPPEYGVNNKLSTQGDAYSYGILVLEMFTGKRPTDDSFNGELNLHKYVERGLPHRAVEITDPKLVFEGEEEEEEEHSDLPRKESRMRAVECITSILRIGISCCRDSPKERMHMEDATRELQNIRDAFLGRQLSACV